MDVATQLKTYLKTISAVTAVVGTSDDARIYLHDAKEGAALPYVVITVQGGQSDVYLGGTSGIAQNRFTILSFGNTQSEAYNLDSIIRRAPLLGYRGAMGTGYCHGVTDGGGFISDFDPPVLGSAQKRYFTARSYIIWHKESTD